MTETTPTLDVAAAAAAWRAAGCSVVPTRLDGSKAPMGAWKAWTGQLPSAADVAGWFAEGHPGIGLVCGAVSGGLEMLELEGRAITGGALDTLRGLVDVAGLDPLWQRLAGGYAEWTPSGGLHLLYRVDGAAVPGNTKLARNAAGEVLAETRGEGGYVVIAPSHGPVHPSGRAWTVVAGRPGVLPVITADERADLHALVRMLDQQPTQPEQPPTAHGGLFAAPARPEPPAGHLSPGDDFEARIDWADELLLGGAGWRLVYTRAGVRYWRRPGKALGISATTGAAGDRDRLYVFTTSTTFRTEIPYTKLGAYAVLHHGGDHPAALTAAARALQQAGYGTQPPAPTFGTGPTAQPATVPVPATLAGPPTDPAALVPPAPPTGFATTLIRRSELRHLPPVAPLIHGILNLRVSAVLVGATGLGKTFLALAWACSVATGAPWLDHDVEQLRTLYVVGEGASGLDTRVSAWEQAWQQKVGDDDLIFSVKPDSLANPTTWTEMRAQALDLGVRFIVLDTFSSLAPDADETKDAATITRRLSDLSAGIDGTAVLIHHPGWGDSGRTRGGYQLEANVDEVIVLSGEKDTDLIEMTRKKVKEGVAGESQWLRRRPMFESVIIETASISDAAAPIGERILALLNATPAARYSVAQLVDELDLKHRSTAYRALDKLVADNLIQVSGKDERRTFSASPTGSFAAPGGRR